MTDYKLLFFFFIFSPQQIVNTVAPDTSGRPSKRDNIIIIYEYIYSTELVKLTFYTRIIVIRYYSNNRFIIFNNTLS